MNILIINGHPDKESFCAALAEAYQKGVQLPNVKSKLIHLVDLKFDPILRYGYRKRTELEPDLIAAFNDIKEADHLVFVYPTWWGTFPALLKGFIDRLFLPGFTYEPRPDSFLYNKLLKGKTARLIVTMDAPTWYYRLIYSKPGHRAMKVGTLEFCGVKPVKVTTIGMVKRSTEKIRAKWLEKVSRLGKESDCKQ